MLREAFRNFKHIPYPNFIADLVEFPTYWTVRAYRENFDEFSQDQQAVICLWLSELLSKLNLYGKAYIEVYAEIPKTGGQL